MDENERIELQARLRLALAEDELTDATRETIGRFLAVVPPSNQRLVYVAQLVAECPDSGCPSCAEVVGEVAELEEAAARAW